MRKITNIASVLATLILAFASCEREDVNRPEEHDGGRPIRFTVESEWPEITKAPIYSLDNLVGDGFVIWGTWHKDPDDDKLYVNEYGDVDSGSVFDKSGTEVIASASGENISWTYEEERDWFRGYYSFAALLPSSKFCTEGTGSSATQTSTTTFSEEEDGSKTIEVVDQLTLTLPEGGFDLSASQTDLMYAFHNEDNSDNKSETVSLKFDHAFAMLSIDLSANDPTKIPHVKTVTVYGINKSISGNIIFTQTETITNYGTTAQNSTLSNTNNIKNIVCNPSTLDSPYAYFEISDEAYVNDTTPEDVTLFENLMVFPETLRADGTQMMIQLEYKTGESSYSTYTVTVKNVIWESGGTYRYSLLMDNLDLEYIE